VDKLVDFSQQLVAVLPGGGRHPATFIGGTIGGHSFHVRVEGYGEVHVGRDGHSFGREIIIRNAAQAHSAKPSTPSNEELTQRMGEEAIDLLCKLAQESDGGGVWDRSRIFGQYIERARTFISDLPKPVDPIDPDEAAAIDQVAHSFVPHTDEAVALAKRCIKLGRTLTAGGTAHE